MMIVKSTLKKSLFTVIKHFLSTKNFFNNDNCSSNSSKSNNVFINNNNDDDDNNNNDKRKGNTGIVHTLRAEKDASVCHLLQS